MVVFSGGFKQDKVIFASPFPDNVLYQEEVRKMQLPCVLHNVIA